MPTQQEIPGTERPKIKAIETAAADYVLARDARMRLTKKEVACRDVLIEAMEKNLDKLGTPNAEGQFIYHFEEEEVVFSKLEKVKVRKAGSEDADTD